VAAVPRKEKARSISGAPATSTQRKGEVYFWRSGDIDATRSNLVP
jgi:hypothetical protein